MTGRYQQRAGIPGVINASFDVNRHHGLQHNEVTLAELLAKNGYRTGAFGKWHLGYEKQYNPLRHGFQEFRGYVSGNIDYHSHVDRVGVLDWWDGLEIKNEPGYTTHLITRDANDFLRRAGTKPFLLYVAYEAPHDPYQGPSDTPQRVAGQLTPLRYAPGQIERAYKEMIEEMDAGIGRLIETLKDLGVSDRTLVFFCSDNGANRHGSNGRWRGHKGSLWEGGHRVPAIASWPGRIPAGQTTDATTISLDVMPTALSLAVISLPADRKLDGKSLLPLLSGERRSLDRGLFWEFGRQAAARQGSWKLMEQRPAARKGVPLRSMIQLFNLDLDPSESHDLAAAYPEKTVALSQALKAWLQDVADGATPQPARP